MEQTATNSVVDGDSQRAKRARISLACTSCREHKTRCDGAKPVCSYCQRRNPRSQVPCLYRNQAKIRESQDVRNLLQRIDQLEGELAAQNSLNSDLGLNRSKKRALPLSSRRQGPQRGPAGSGLLSASHLALVKEVAGRQAPESETQPCVNSQRNGHYKDCGSYQSGASANEIRSRSPSVSGSGDLTVCDVPGGHRVSDSDSLTTMLLNPVCEPYADVPLPSASDKQLLPGASQQIDRLDTTSSDLPTARAHAPQENDEPYFYGESSTTTTLMDEVNEMISPSVHGNSGHSRGTPSVSSAPIYPKREDNSRALCSNTLDDRNNVKDFDLPPRSLADHLIKSYFDRVHILYPFLHRPTFESAYEKLWVPTTSDDIYGNHGRSDGLVDTGLGSFSHSGPASRVFYCALNTIFALSCQFSEMRIPTVSKAATGYLERAMELLMNTDLLDNGCISLVQVLLLLCLHLQSTPLRNRLWNIIGLAVRMAQGLGLQDEVDEGYKCGEMQTEVHTEIRRRVWYACMMLDMTVSMTLGRSPIVSEGYTVPFPRPLSDENLHRPTTLIANVSLPPPIGISLASFFIEAIKLSELTDKLLKSLYSRSTTTSKSSAEGYKERKGVPIRDFGGFIQLETTWNALFNNIPPELCLTHDGIDAGRLTNPKSLYEMPFGYLERQRNVLHARFLHVKALLYRPIFLQFCHEANPRNKPRQNRARSTKLPSGFEAATATMHSSFSNHCATACFRTAKDLIHLVHITHSTRSASAWWYNIFYAYTSGVVIILSRHCSPLTKILGISTIEETWFLCQEILKNMAIYGAHAKRCLLSLEDLDSRLASWESDSSRPDEGQNSTIDSDRVSHERPNVDSIHPNTSPDYTSVEESSSRRGNSNQSWIGGDIVGGVYKDLNPLEKNNIPSGNLPIDTDLGPEMAGMLPWDVDFNDWWTFNLDGTEFQGATWPGMADF